MIRKNRAKFKFGKRALGFLLALTVSASVACSFAENLPEEKSGGTQEVKIVTPAIEQESAAKDICGLIQKDGVAYATVAQDTMIHMDLGKGFDYHTIMRAGVMVAITEYVVDGEEIWLRVWYLNHISGAVVNGYIPYNSIDGNVISAETATEIAAKIGGQEVDSNIDSKILFYNK
jgi:hypothetical protein